MFPQPGLGCGGDFLIVRSIWRHLGMKIPFGQVLTKGAYAAARHRVCCNEAEDVGMTLSYLSVDQTDWIPSALAGRGWSTASL